MEPGRELDALIAKKIMGLTVYPAKDDEVYFDPVRDRGDAAYEGELLYKASNETLVVPYYSTDIAAAWEVAERALEITTAPGPKGGSRVCAFTVREAVGSERNDRKDYNFSVQFKDYHAKKSIWEAGKSAPHAICLAALKFLESR